MAMGWIIGAFFVGVTAGVIAALYLPKIFGAAADRAIEEIKK